MIILVYEKNFGFLKKSAFLIALVAFHQTILMLHHFDLVMTSFNQTIRELSLYCFPIVFLSFIRTIDDKKDKALLCSFFEIIIAIVVATTYIGFLFSVPYFATYNTRFGYLGILPKSITATYFYISALIYTYYFINKNIKVKALFYLTLIASLLVGTKSIYLFVLLLAGYLFFVNKWYKKKLFYSIVTFFALLFWMNRTIITIALKKIFHSFFALYYKKGLLTAVSSFRDENFYKVSQKYEPTWEWYNYLIGGRISNFPIYEMTIIDLIVSFGLIGMIYYLYILRSMTASSAPYSSCFVKFSLCSVFIISIFAGQFFTNISAISCVILALFLINRSMSNPQ
jgi:hypothetical protein